MLPRACSWFNFYVDCSVALAGDDIGSSVAFAGDPIGSSVVFAGAPIVVLAVCWRFQVC